MACDATSVWHFDGMAPEDICRGVTRGLGLGDELSGIDNAGLAGACLKLAELLAGAIIEIRSLEGGAPIAGAITVTDADDHDRLVFQASRDCTDSNMRPSSDAYRGGSGSRKKKARDERKKTRSGDEAAPDATDTPRDPEGMPEGLTTEEAERWSADAALHDPEKGLREPSGRRAGKQPGAKGHGIRIPEDALREQLSYAVPECCSECPNLAACAQFAQLSHRKSFLDASFTIIQYPFMVVDPAWCPMGLLGPGDDAGHEADADEANTSANDAVGGETAVANGAAGVTACTDGERNETTDTNVDDADNDADGGVPEGYTLVTAERVGLEPEGERLEGVDPTMDGAVFARPAGTTMYGPRVRALAVCQTCVAMCAYERSHDVVAPMLGLSLSTGTMSAMVSAFAAQVRPVVDQILRVLREGGGVVNCDETGVNVGGANHWAHSACTQLYTFISVQRSRGKAGLDAAGFLAFFVGIVVHDCWGSYWRFENVTHALCDEHVLRELLALHKYFRGCRVWALEMSDLLVLMRDTRDEYEAAGHERVPRNVRDALRALYERILDDAVAEIPPPPEPEPGRRGRPKRGKALSLVDRMREREDQFLLFLDDFRVPFTNNLAEQSFRLVSSKKHVCGCFRTLEGADDFFAIWSFFSTARKHGHSYWEAAVEASSGRGMELIFPHGVEAAIEERRRESEGLPLKPAKDEKAEDAA